MEYIISLPDGHEGLTATGVAQQNLKIIRESLGVKLSARGDKLRINGEHQSVRRAAYVVKKLIDSAASQKPMVRQELLDTIASVNRLSFSDSKEISCVEVDESPPGDGLEVYLGARRIRALTDRQRAYLEAIHDHDLTICTGPAGTGKTYLAVASAVNMLKQGRVRRLILVRPAVEAGEKLGFLPGSMQEKVNPYLRPLLDALHDMMELDQVQHFMANDVIEVVPLAFMRGRTLNDALIILDEAQNTTRSQMLMFLTRLGHHGKMIVTGDTSQTDLQDPRYSGLVDALRRLRRVKGVAMVTLDPTDIVRHDLVQRIVAAYDDEPVSDNDSMEAP